MNDGDVIATGQVFCEENNISKVSLLNIYMGDHVYSNVYTLQGKNKEENKLMVRIEGDGWHSSDKAGNGIYKKQKNKKNNKKRVEKKKSTYPSEDEDVFNLTWDEKEERTKTSTTRKMYERSEDKISESKIDKTTDKEKEFFGKRIVNFLKKCYNRCKNFITKIRKITNKMEMIGDLLEDEDIIDAVKRIKRYGVNGVKLLLPQKLNAKIIFGFEDPYYTGKVLGWTAALIPIYGDHINITPDFEKRILKGELKIKGRIRRYKILYLLWKVYKDKDELIKQKDRAIRMIGGS